MGLKLALDMGILAWVNVTLLTFGHELVASSFSLGRAWDFFRDRFFPQLVGYFSVMGFVSVVLHAYLPTMFRQIFHLLA